MAKECVNTNCKKEIPSNALFCSFCGAQQVEDLQLSEEEKLRKEMNELQETITLLKKALANAQQDSDSIVSKELEITRLQMQLSKVQDKNRIVFSKPQFKLKEQAFTQTKSNNDKKFIIISSTILFIILLIAGLSRLNIKSDNHKTNLFSSNNTSNENVNETNTLSSTNVSKINIKSVMAESEMPKYEEFSFDSKNTIDNDLTTWWSPLQNESWILFKFDEAIVSEIRIHAGAHYPNSYKYGDLYYLNNRITSLKLVFSDGSEKAVYLSDIDDIQNISINPIKTSSITLIPITWIDGSKWKDNCISEVSIYGNASINYN